MLTLLIKHNTVDACTDNKHRLSSLSKGICSYPKNRGSCMIKTDLQKASWGATGWHVGLLPDQESLTGHHLLWNRIVGRQSASPAAHAQRCNVYIIHHYIYISNAGTNTRVYLQELIERLLAALQLVHYIDQCNSDASPGTKREDSVVSLNIWYNGPKTQKYPL